jgi:putative glycerol-1-phosphate prenyltransferase
MNATFYSGWRHVFKLDPDRSIDDRALEAVCQSGTDAILVGGSTGVTFENTVDLLARIRRYAVPCALELSDAQAGVPGFDGYFIPFVLNAGRREWLIGHHVDALKRYGHLLPWASVIGEAYLVLNPDSAAARISEALPAENDDEVLAYSHVADRLWRVPVLYVEYSGTFGDMKLIRRMREELRQAQLFYGGGIDSPEKAREAAAAADTVVVGNAVYQNLEAALATVDAVKHF